jgi:hypothetical protein
MSLELQALRRLRAETQGEKLSEIKHPMVNMALGIFSLIHLVASM